MGWCLRGECGWCWGVSLGWDLGCCSGSWLWLSRLSHHLLRRVLSKVSLLAKAAHGRVSDAWLLWLLRGAAHGLRRPHWGLRQLGLGHAALLEGHVLKLRGVWHQGPLLWALRAAALRRPAGDEWH